MTRQHTNAFPDLDRDLRFIPLGVEEPRTLTPTQVRRYNEVGHLFPIDIFSPGEIAEIRGYIDDLLAGALAAGWDNYQVVNWHKCCRGIWDIVTDSRIIDVVADLLGDTVILRHSHLFAKLPGDAPVALEMRAGQISLHGDWILHGSEPNRSNRRRCGLAMRYLSADVRAYDGWNTNSTWCRGTDAGGHWANHPRPDGEDIPTPESGAADDPVTEASLSPHRQQ